MKTKIISFKYFLKIEGGQENTTNNSETIIVLIWFKKKKETSCSHASKKCPHLSSQITFKRRQIPHVIGENTKYWWNYDF